MVAPISNDAARTMRALWFEFLDTIEGVRPRLHAYCLRLTGAVWDAEDLVQETLLRAFGSIGRGDLHGEHSRLERPQAYLCQIATNLWIDRVRRSRLEASHAQASQAGATGEPAILTPAAGASLFERTAPQERAAVVLKDVFDFSLDEIAEILTTTPGAVKSALHRGREKLGDGATPVPHRSQPASRALVDRFVAAFNARDMAAIVAILLESTSYEPLGVGGERGRNTIWLTVPVPDIVVAEPQVIDGELVVAFTFAADGRRRLGNIERLEEVEGRISRIVNYYFCPDTIAYAAEKLGLEAWSNGYHQDARTLGGMIADSQLPWRRS